MNSFSPMAPVVAFIPPVLSFAGAGDVAQILFIPLLPTAPQAPTPQDHHLPQQSAVGHPVLASHCPGAKYRYVKLSLERGEQSPMCTQSRVPQHQHLLGFVCDLFP